MTLGLSMMLVSEFAVGAIVSKWRFEVRRQSTADFAGDTRHGELLKCGCFWSCGTVSIQLLKDSVRLLFEDR
jgi:hypothetical protein